jgi:hypothetical protein
MSFSIALSKFTNKVSDYMKTPELPSQLLQIKSVA